MVNRSSSPLRSSFKDCLAKWNQRDSKTDASSLDVFRLGRTSEFVRLGSKRRFSVNKTDAHTVGKSSVSKNNISINRIDRAPEETTAQQTLSPPPLESPILMKKNYSPVVLHKAYKKEKKLEGANSQGPLANASKRLRKGQSTRKLRTKSIRAKPLLELRKEFTPSVVRKAAEDEQVLRAAVTKNFVFEKVVDSAVEQLVQAFEETSTYEPGQVIIQQGDEGDYFYVVKAGEVSFEVNKKVVGSAKAGASFGELALLYTCPRAATVKATAGTKLWRLEQTVFRYVLQSQTRESKASKLKLLENIDFFNQMEKEDLERCVKVMTPRRYESGEYIVTKGDDGDAFYVIESGELKVTDISVGETSYEDVSLGPGEFFGERALVKSEPRAANVIGMTSGTLFSIDRETFEKVCGSFVRLILKSQDKSRLSGLKVVKAAGLDAETVAELSQYLEDEMYRKGKDIFVQGEETRPALYLVREGLIQIRYSDGTEKIIKEGGYFGEEHLLADAKGKVVKEVIAKYSATAIQDQSICGVLTLADCRKVFDTKAIEISPELHDDDYAGIAIDGDDEFKSIVGRRSSRWSSIDMSSLRDSLVRESVLGEGQFGEVWEVTTSLEMFHDSSKFALKIQSKADTSRASYSAIDAIKRECGILSSLDHPFIVDLVHHYEDEENVYMVMGLIKGGDLWAVIHRENEMGEWISGFSEAQAKFYAFIVADTIDFLHTRQIVFRDLKPENIMIDDDGYPIIVDFGFAKVLKDGVTYTFCGTPQYICPEIATNAGHGYAVDHWALGVTIYEMVAGESPFWYEDIETMTLFNDICREQPFPLPDKCTDEVRDLVDRLLVKDPTQRIGSMAKGSREIKMHPWFHGLDLQKARQKQIKAPWIPDTK